MADEVLPFRRKGQPPRSAPLPPSHQALTPQARRSAPEARELAAQQAAAAREGYSRAVRQQEDERLLREETPVPARITMALDFGGHEGPDVDIACGAVEPAVDLWECGVEVPAAGQVKLLSKLTGFPVHFFYLPIEPGPVPGPGPIWMCSLNRRKGNRCQAVEPDYVDERGVLHYGGEPPRRPPASVQGALF